MTGRPLTAKSQVFKGQNTNQRPMSTRAGSSSYANSFSRNGRTSLNFARVVQITSNQHNPDYLMLNPAISKRPETTGNQRFTSTQFPRFNSTVTPVDGVFNNFGSGSEANGV